MIYFLYIYVSFKAFQDDQWSFALKSDALYEYCKYTYCRQQGSGFKLQTELNDNYLIFDLGGMYF